VLVTVWVTINTFLVIGTGRLGRVLSSLGVLDDVVNGVEYLIARIISVATMGLIFFSLYRWLPSRRTPWRIALIGASVAAALLEAARWAFALYVPNLDAGSLYTGTLAALVIVVFWVYYAAVIFIIGAEVAHAAEKALAPPAAP
jgi:membrane protein